MLVESGGLKAKNVLKNYLQDPDRKLEAKQSPHNTSFELDIDSEIIDSSRTYPDGHSILDLKPDPSNETQPGDWMNIIDDWSKVMFKIHIKYFVLIKCMK